MAKWYTGIQIDFAHRGANSQVNLYLRGLAHKHWDSTDSRFKIQERTDTPNRRSKIDIRQSL